MSTATDACPVIDPVGQQGREPVPPVPPLPSLERCRVALLDITKVRSEVFVDQIETDLRSAGVLEIERGIAPPSQRLPDTLLREIGSRCDAAVLALADCGTCTSWTLFDAIELHRHGCRAVLVTTTPLLPTVRALAGRLGMDDLPVVSVDTPNREQTPDEIIATAAKAAPSIVAALVGGPQS